MSQGSVAVPLRCGGIFKNNFFANLLVNLSYGEVMDKSLVSCFLFHSVYCKMTTFYCESGWDVHEWNVESASFSDYWYLSFIDIALLKLCCLKKN